MAEMLNIVSETGEIVGTETREKIHHLGLLHREINVWLYTPRGELICQHRALDKDTFPDMLDASCGGHVEIGDDYPSTAVKELNEETGLNVEPEQLHLIEQIHINVYDPATNMRNNALQNVYALRYDGEAKDLRVEPGKAIGFEVWPIEKLLHLTDEETRLFIFPVFGPQYLNILRKIKQLAEAAS
jgi:isopentenyldiphosphate isomerase